MARRVRREFPRAVHHAINRGNYRTFIFETEGARQSFLDCLDQCCAAQGWASHAWLAEEDGEKERLGFEKMCRGWVKGTKDFRKTVLEGMKDGTARRVLEAEAGGMREPRWERAVGDLLLRFERGEEELASGAKGGPGRWRWRGCCGSAL